MTNAVTDKEWLALLASIYKSTSISTTTTKFTVNKISDDAVTAIPVDKLKELHDNLIYSGFSDTEALVITAQVASNAKRTI